MTRRKNFSLPLIFRFILSCSIFAFPATTKAHDSPDLADLVSSVEGSVVNISTLPREEHGGDKESKQKSPRSGFLIRSDGYVVTPTSMLNLNEDIYVAAIGGKKLRAQVIGQDTRTDVAVLKVEGTNWQAIKAADTSSVRTGQRVVLVGSAFAGISTVADGIVSHHDKNRVAQSVTPYIALSVPIHPGNGGAPVFNLQGEALGMVSEVYAPPNGSKFSNLAFAVPIDAVLSTAATIVRHGRVARGSIRVSIQEVTKELSNELGLGNQPRGAYVAGVATDGPAARAGIEAGDVLLEFSGQPLKRFTDLPRLVAETAPGDKVPVVVFRRGRTLELTVEMGN